MLSSLPALPAIAAGSSNFQDFYPKNEVSKPYISRANLGEEGVVGLCQTLVLP